VRLLELEMFYRQRREINKQRYLEVVKRKLSQGTSYTKPSSSTNAVRLQSLGKNGPTKLTVVNAVTPSFRDESQFGFHLRTFDKSPGIKIDDFSKNHLLD